MDRPKFASSLKSDMPKHATILILETACNNRPLFLVSAQSLSYDFERVELKRVCYAQCKCWHNAPKPVALERGPHKSRLRDRRAVA